MKLCVSFSLLNNECEIDYEYIKKVTNFINLNAI